MNPQKQKSKKARFVLAIAAILISAWWLLSLKNHSQTKIVATPPAAEPKPAFSVSPAWPNHIAAAAVGAEGYGVLAKTGDKKPRPIASIAKVITSLAILEKHPLAQDDPGPLIPITEQDEQLYRKYLAKNGTVALVKAGVPVHQREAMQAMLMMSANNFADTTAAWAFGSLKEYRQYANKMLQKYGIKDTTVGVDASGLDPSTKSTASDLVKLGEVALKNPVIADIISTKWAYIPVAGSVPNYNSLVVNHDYTGIKPGESIEAGNTLLFSTKEIINGKEMTIIGAELGSPGYKESNRGAMQIVDSVKTSLKPN